MIIVAKLILLNLFCAADIHKLSYELRNSRGHRCEDKLIIIEEKRPSSNNNVQVPLLSAERNQCHNLAGARQLIVVLTHLY